MRAETLTLIRILLIGVVAYVVIRVASAAARRLERDMSRGEGIDGAERKKRARTIGRIVQKTISIVIATMAVLMVLRQLDIDILWIDGENIDEADLQVPHPRMWQRRFVLVPLADVAPELLPAGWEDRVDGWVTPVEPL